VCCCGSACLSAHHHHRASTSPCIAAPPILVPALVNERKHHPRVDKAKRTNYTNKGAAKPGWLCLACLRGILVGYIYGKNAARRSTTGGEQGATDSLFSNQKTLRDYKSKCFEQG